MDLKRVVEAGQDEKFDALQADGSFSFWSNGRLAPVDRFLSNFHKPLQRRMLFSDPNIPYPDTYVVRQNSTGEIYLIGQGRQDAQDNEAYDRLSVLHSVDTLSSDRVEYFNYAGVDPATAGVGELGKVSEGFFYISYEYVSTKGSEYGDEAYQGKYLLFGPANLPFKRDGVLTLNGSSYKIIQGHIDSGFSVGVAISQPDDMQQVEYLVVDESASGYDAETGTMTLTHLIRRYPATVDQIRRTHTGVAVYNIFIKNPTITERFLVGNDLRLANGKTVHIKAVNEDENTQGQYNLVCEGT